MITPNAELERRIREYATQRGCTLVDFLGGGNDGDVWKSDRQSAVKAFYHDKNYRMELGAYLRLRSYDVTEILRMAVPRLIAWDEGLRIVEVDIVSPPCIIDFGKSYLDSAPDHSEETWEDYHQQQRELWGDRYDDVQAVLWKLQTYGIIYRDPTPKNIMFGSRTD
jgi:hypothetical protein